MNKIDIVDIKSALKNEQLKLFVEKGFIYLKDTETQEKIVILEFKNYNENKSEDFIQIHNTIINKKCIEYIFMIRHPTYSELVISIIDEKDNLAFNFKDERICEDELNRIRFELKLEKKFKERRG